MPLTEAKPPQAPRPLLVVLAILVLGALSLLVWKQKGHSGNSVSEPPANVVQADKTVPSPAGHVAAAPRPGCARHGHLG